MAPYALNSYITPMSQTRIYTNRILFRLPFLQPEMNTSHIWVQVKLILINVDKFSQEVEIQLLLT